MKHNNSIQKYITFIAAGALGVVALAMSFSDSGNLFTFIGNTSVTGTNFVSEIKVTNAITLNGTRITSWSAGGGNMTNSGASVVGMIPVYTDTSGTAVTPTNTLTSLDVGTLTFTGGSANVVPVLDGNTNLVASTTTTNDLLYLHNLAGLTSWTQVTPSTTNSVINLSGALAGIDKNFYYSLSTSNYIIFSNLVAGAQGTIWVNCSGTPQQLNFSASYDNFSTNEIAPVFSVTNRAIIAYKVGWGTDATNVMLAIKRK